MSPSLPKLSNIYRKLKQYNTRLIYTVKYGSAGPNINNLIHVDPNQIKYSMVRKPEFLNEPGSLIVGGDWDVRISNEDIKIPCYTNKEEFEKLANDKTNFLYKFSNYDHYKSFYQHYINGKPWEDTEFYDMLMTNIEKNSPKYRPREKVIERLNYNDMLFESIKENGFLSQNNLISSQTSPELSTKDSDIHIGIGRNGNLIYLRKGGTHRLTMAKILNIDTIPVRIKIRHNEWQDMRNNIIRNNSLNTGKQRNYMDHPDVKHIIGEEEQQL